MGEQEHAKGPEDEVFALGMIEERLEVARLDVHEDEGDGAGHEGENEAGEASVGGEGADFAAEGLGFAHCFREAAEDLAEVSAGAHVGFDGGDEHGDLDEGDAAAHVFEGGSPGAAEADEFDDFADLEAKWGGLFDGEVLEGDGHGVSGAEGVGQGVESIGELLFEFPEPGVAAVGEVEVRE